MKDNLIQIFDGIDKKELKSLFDFVNSPFYNKSKRLADFYELIYKNFDIYKANGLSKKELAKKLYPGESFTKKTDENIRKLISDFGKLLDSYLVSTKFLQDEDQRALTLVKTLRERGVEDRFKKKLTDLKKKQGRVKYRDEKYYKLENELIEEELKLEFAKKMIRYSETDQRASDFQDWNFLLNKLKIFSRMWTKQFYNKDKLVYDWKFYDEISEFIRNNLSIIEDLHPIIYLEFCTLELFKNGNPENLRRLKNYLFEKSSSIPKTEYTDYSWNIISYSSLQINKGNTEYRKDVIDVLVNLDEEELLINAGDMLPSDFKLAVDISIAERKLDWAEYFINKFKNKIKKEYSKGLVNLSLAKLYFYKSDFLQSKKYQAKIDYNDYVHYFDAKMLLAKIEFELDNFGNVLSAIETLKKFIKSHAELPDIYRNAYKNFSEYIVRLIKLYENSFIGKCDMADVDFFYDELLKNPIFIHSKDWFIEKLDNLKKESEFVS